ncbi:hypothetical protein CHS0354_016438 [Potamilus streckersoni]|uniref:A-kinase anchor protein 7-like phosphoesterase domain-containing protein n=1 Tax=Potamilus streckersoni TaxID=2493646 RepID=A0AAE0WG18_9BIVA|nr:hypothetical protein CHS0354_016438 [Potamilus streckersoni]
MYIFTSVFIPVFFIRLFAVMKRKLRVFKRSLLLSIKIGLIFNRFFCVYRPAPFGAFFPCVWYRNCTRYSVMASERSPPLGSFLLLAKIPKLSLPSPSSPKSPELTLSNQSLPSPSSPKPPELTLSNHSLLSPSSPKPPELTMSNQSLLSPSSPKTPELTLSNQSLPSPSSPKPPELTMSNQSLPSPSSPKPPELTMSNQSLPSPSSPKPPELTMSNQSLPSPSSPKPPELTLSNQSLPSPSSPKPPELTMSNQSLPSPSSPKPPELTLSNQSQKEDRLDSTHVGFQKVPWINVDTVNKVHELEKEILPKNAGQKRKVSDEILDEHIKPDNSDVMMNFVVTGLPSALEFKKKSTILPPSLLQGVTDFVRKTIVTDACKSEPSGVVKHSDKSLITEADVKCELSTLEMLTGSATENIDMESNELFKDASLVKKESSVVRTTKKESSVVGTTKKESSVVGTTEKESSVVGTTKKKSLVVGATNKKSSVVGTTENKLVDLKDAYDISVLFSEKFDKEFKKYKRQAKKRAKEKARKQKRNDVQSSKKQSEEGEDESSEKITKKKKLVPNYFIAIQITNPVIHEALRKVQKRVVEQSKEHLPALNPIPTLHLTVFVMHLASNEDIQRAKDALDECCKELQYMHNPLILDIHGLGHFRNEVVFAKVSPDENVQKLQKIADVVGTYFEAHNIPPVDKKGFKPHITVMKLSRAPKLRKKGIKKIESYLFQEFLSSYFGIQEVSGLQLCAMLKPKAKSGYYQVEHENVFGETTKADDELFKMSSTIVQSCIKAAVYRLEQENLASEMSQGEKIVYVDQKSESSQDKEMNLYQNEQIKDPDAAKCAEKQEIMLVHDDKLKSPHDD